MVGAACQVTHAVIEIGRSAGWRNGNLVKPQAAIGCCTLELGARKGYLQPPQLPASHAASAALRYWVQSFAMPR